MPRPSIPTLAGPGAGEAELVFPAGPAAPALLHRLLGDRLVQTDPPCHGRKVSTSARPVRRARTPRKVSASRRPLRAGGPRPSMAGDSPQGREDGPMVSVSRCSLAVVRGRQGRGPGLQEDGLVATDIEKETDTEKAVELETDGDVTNYVCGGGNVARG